MIRGALEVERVHERRTKTRRGWVATATWRCACERVVTLPLDTRSRDCGCGCYARPKHEEHGGSNLSIYEVWRSMVRRCADAENPRYGARGITVCERWRTSFAAFLRDVGVRPFDGATLDREDNSRGYEPGNVRWATATTQNRNKGNNRVVVAFGEARCVAEWSERFGVPARTIAKRLDDLGWPPESAVSTPTGGA